MKPLDKGATHLAAERLLAGGKGPWLTLSVSSVNTLMKTSVDKS